jgi:hypothetical protein
MSTTHYPYQSYIEDFIKTAESMGHKGWAKLSRSHPAIQERQWSQIRGNRNILAFYSDGLGNQVELVAFGVANPFVRHWDNRRTFYGRLRGAQTGWAFKANSLAEARVLLIGLEHVDVDSSYLIVSPKDALGVTYRHI